MRAGPAGGPSVHLSAKRSLGGRRFGALLAVGSAPAQDAQVDDFTGSNEKSRDVIPAILVGTERVPTVDAEGQFFTSSVPDGYTPEPPRRPL